MLKIRLQRVGRVHEPIFRLVLTDSKNSTKSGRYLEVLGSFDMRHDNLKKIDVERVKHWIAQGAQPSDTVHNYLVAKKHIEGKKRNALPLRTAIKKEAPAAAETPAPAAAPTA